MLFWSPEACGCHETRNIEHKTLFMLSSTKGLSNEGVCIVGSCSCSNIDFIWGSVGVGDISCILTSPQAQPWVHCDL